MSPRRRKQAKTTLRFDSRRMRRICAEAEARGLVGPDAALLPGAGPAVRLQLIHPDDRRRCLVLDFVWDRAPGATAGLHAAQDYLLFRGWSGDGSTPLKGTLLATDGHSLEVAGVPWADERWRYLEQLPPCLNEQAPPPGAPYVAVWVPSVLSAPVQEWLSALEYQTVPSQVAQAISALMHGFFGTGGIGAVQKGLSQLATALTGGPTLQ